MGPSRRHHIRVLVGSGAVAMHDVVIHSNAVVGAGAVLTDGTEVPERAMALGVPARVRLDAVARDFVSEGVDLYVGNGERYRAELRRMD